MIEKYGLLDGKIVVAGATDSYGNPVTDEIGNAVIRYIAGNKEGIVKIPAVYQGAGYTWAPRDEAFIKVKKEEFVFKSVLARILEITFGFIYCRDILSG
ncbi:MAG: hypothetical protein H0Z19_01175 [Archaeoglobus sp.]|uniref:hypothetical protein n=1 Tax=Archaeoglobus sp. TaxID=1872626 RepID=UPI001D2D0ACA|nr:hypothetical protein [Archaeoglobus sp.]MBO8179086.1 hypothetical protein [Archaeoglobus sp.]